MKPEEFLKIAQKHPILPGLVRNSRVYGRPEQMALSLSDEKGVVNGENVSCYRLHQAGIKEGFSAYICDYEEGQIHYQVLGDEADFCFTITINGCTFAIGTPASDGTLIVSHTNSRGDKLNSDDKTRLGHHQGLTGAAAQAWQTKAQSAVAEAFHRSGRLIDRNIYNSNNTQRINITVFGLRINNAWEFYYQKLEVNGGIWTLISLNSFAANSRQF